MVLVDVGYKHECALNRDRRPKSRQPQIGAIRDTLLRLKSCSFWAADFAFTVLAETSHLPRARGTTHDPLCRSTPGYDTSCTCFSLPLPFEQSVTAANHSQDFTLRKVCLSNRLSLHLLRYTVKYTIKTSEGGVFCPTISDAKHSHPSDGLKPTRNPPNHCHSNGVACGGFKVCQTGLHYGVSVTLIESLPDATISIPA